MALTRRELTKEAVGLNQERVVEVYGCPNSELESQVAALRGSVHPDYSGMNAPVCMHASGRGNVYRDDEAMITAVWRTLDWQEWMLENRNQAIVFSSPSQTAQRRVRDLDGRLIEGTDEELLWAFWEIDEGENINLRPKESVVVHAIVDSKPTHLDPFDGLIGRINGSIMPNLAADSEPGHLLYLGKRVSRVFDEDELYEVMYVFLHHWLEWNSQCLVKQWYRKFQQYPLYLYGSDPPTVVSGAFRAGLIKTETGQEFYAKLFQEGDFSLINGLCSW